MKPRKLFPHNITEISGKSHNNTSKMLQMFIESVSLRRDEKSHARLSLNRVFYCDRWSKNRCVTSMDWSTHFPELLLASYHNNEELPNEPDGVVMVWNTKFKKQTPEDIFHCQSAVMATCFAKFHPNLILGGTYSGQIVLWDNRVQKRTPIQRSTLNADAHTVSNLHLHCD